MNDLRRFYDGLPDGEKDEVMSLLLKILMRRGRSGLSALTSEGYMEGIAEVFRRNGKEIAVYT